MTDTRRTVKLYALNANGEWNYMGVGQIGVMYVERLRGISMLLRAESDGTLLFESKIKHDTAYEKQRDTLIAWTESENLELALNFHESLGCDEIWEQICQVQGKDPSVLITQENVKKWEE